jgi:hypothetical protein
MLLSVQRPQPIVLRRPLKKKNPVHVRADVNGIELAGKCMGLFVLFTSTMNWWFYRRVRKEGEKKKPTDDE